MVATNTLLTRKQMRNTVYFVLIASSIGVMIGRIASITASTGETAMLSANDRSRWCTIRALGDEGTYEIDNVVQLRHPETKRRHWYTIDMVRHQGKDDRQHYYSSKPALFPTLLAWEYWALKTYVGVDLDQDTFYVQRLMIGVTNVIPLAIYFILLVRLVERLGCSDWGRMFAVAAATWGTFLTTFAVTLNNHLPAAISVLIAIHAALPIWQDGARSLPRFIVAGVFSAFAAANELPALSFLIVLTGAMLIRSPLRALLGFFPGAALVVAGFFYTNHLAHNDWWPPYAHRQDGSILTQVEKNMSKANGGLAILNKIRPDLADHNETLSSNATLKAEHEAGRWVIDDPETGKRFAVVESGSQLEIRRWDNWYRYDGSYWTSGKKVGIDQGESLRADYAFHVLIGHHGILSLTPLWGFSLIGMMILLVARERKLRGFAAMVTTLTVVCLVFYIFFRDIEDRNYGGVSCAFRWMFWFTPLWLICLLPVADWLASNRVLRGVGLVVLCLSSASAMYAAGNPWSHPWLYDYLRYLQLLS